MRKFKIEDFKVGDKVTLVGTVKEIDKEKPSWPLLIWFGTPDNDEWVKIASIETHERAIKVGDRVKGNDSVILASVLAADGDEIWLKADDDCRWTACASEYEIVS